MKKKTDELQSLRSELLSLNNEFVNILNSREKIVKEIQNCKRELHFSSAWDPAQEFKVFSRTIQSTQKVDYLMMFSLLVESQARITTDYPEWSKGVHLLEKTGTIYDFMNPILVYLINVEIFSKLKLNDEYKNKITKISGEYNV